MSGVEIKKGRSLTFPSTLILWGKIKTLEGYHWHPEERYWNFPNTDDHRHVGYRKVLS